MTPEEIALVLRAAALRFDTAGAVHGAGQLRRLAKGTEEGSPRGLTVADLEAAAAVEVTA